MANGLHLIYFADPMCSWCWGFAPVVETIRQLYGEALPIRPIMGGLRPGTDKAMTDKAKADTRHHWEMVGQASGQPFDMAFFDREGFVYDTDPAARAVVLVRREDPVKALTYLERAQRAFYAENRDVTDPKVLAELAAGLGVAHPDFAGALEDQGLKEETWSDYGISQRAGVTGFPTLIAGPNDDGTYVMVTQGFNAAESVIPMVNRWVNNRMAAMGAAQGTA